MTVGGGGAGGDGLDPPPPHAERLSAAAAATAAEISGEIDSAGSAFVVAATEQSSATRSPFVPGPEAWFGDVAQAYRSKPEPR